MPKFTQDGRLMAVSTPLGKDAVLLETLDGTEALSEPFSFELGLLAPPGEVKFEALLGQPVTIRLDTTSDPAARVTRYVHGIVSRLAQGEEVREALGPVTFVRYRAEVVPKLWLLGRRARTRTFQQVSVPDILKKVFADLDTQFDLQGTYEKRDYCTQYRETDLAFASRLMEEEGIYYFFKHADGRHTLVVADAPSAHPDVPAPTALLYDTARGGIRPEDRIVSWEKSQEVRSGKVTLWDHCFELPGKDLQAADPAQADVPVGKVSHKLKTAVNGELELYDYPGGYAQRFDGVAPGGADRDDDVQKIFQDNARTAKIRMQRETARAVLVRGAGGCRQMTAGHAFTLARHYDADGKYVLTAVHHSASVEGEYTGGNPDSRYTNRFECVPFGLPYRPPLRAPRPVIAGPQTAVVVGPDGEEIFTDKYGRVKVQFAWDRDGKKDPDSSCWVRVATAWAGKQWGAIHIPRIGQEVVVVYEEGDPDRPIAVGSVYNAEQMPPYDLPDHRTRSTLKTRSSLKGTEENFNELRFEDKKDEEEVYFHAEKDFNRVVENNDTLKVGFEKKDKGDRTVEVFNNHVVKVGAGEGEAADGSETLTVYKDRTATLKTGNETLAVKMGNRAATIDMGNDSLIIKTGNQTTKLDLGKSTTEAMQSIELKVGGNSIKVDQSGVTIKGIMVKVEGTAMTQVKAPMTQVNGDGMLTLKGGITMIG